MRAVAQQRHRTRTLGMRIEVSARVVPAIHTRDGLSAFRVARVLLQAPEDRLSSAYASAARRAF